MIAIIDGNGLAWRSVHRREPPPNPRGHFYGWTSDLLEIREKLGRPTMLVVFDGGRSVMRTEIFGGYKANRKATPDRARAIEGMQAIQAGMDILGSPYIRVEGVEADDVVSIIARISTEKGIPTTIVSEDSDLYQCLSSHVRIYHPRKQEVMNAEDALAEWGSAERYILAKSLAGDTKDNIPGFPGIGADAAKTLVSLSRGVPGNLFTERMKRTVPQLKGNKGPQKKFRILFEAGAADYLRTQMALIRTATTYERLGNLAKPTQDAVEGLLKLHRSPTMMNQSFWNQAVLEKLDALPMIAAVEDLETLYAFRVVR